MNTKQIAFFASLLAIYSCSAATPNAHQDSATTVELDAPYMVLSDETNFLKSGIFLGNTNHIILVQHGIVASEISLVLLNTSTNEVDFLTPWPNRVESQFEIKMNDAKGHAVPKTLLGEKVGQSPIKVPDNTFAWKADQYGLKGSGLPPKADMFYSLTRFDLKKSLPQYFELQKPGDYKFTLVHHIYVNESRTNGYFLKPITFSPITVDVRVEKDAE